MRIPTAAFLLAGMLSACTDSSGPEPGPTLTKVSGDGQTAPTGARLMLPLVVQASDLEGTPVSGALVEWEVTAGGGTLSASSSQTDPDGAAKTWWQLGPAAGQNTAVATVAGGASAAFIASATIPVCSCPEPTGADVGCSITGGAAEPSHPSISGHRVVWEDRSGTRTAIRLLDLLTGGVTTITPEDTENLLPAIDGDGIVYVRAPFTGPWELYHYDAQSGEEALFSTIDRSVGLGRFSISGDRIAWHERRDENWDVYVHDVGQQQETRVTSDAADQADPSISGDVVAWLDRRHDGVWWDLYMMDLSTGVEQRITESTTAARGPAVAGGTIVWGDTRGQGFSLHAYDLQAQEERAFSTSPIENQIAFNGSTVAWVDRNDASPTFHDDIFLFHMPTQRELRLTSSPELQWWPSLTQECVVWEDHRSGTADIYIASLYELPWP